MKIIQIVAAYKPAYIYGGPTMSVAKLCETLVVESLKLKVEGTKLKQQEFNKEQNYLFDSQESTGYEKELETNGHRTINNENFEIEVYTTTANGKTELDVTPNETTIVDGVRVTYFKRLTKDHTHFSPALLWRLRRECLNSRRKTSVKHSLSFGEGWGEAKLIIHIHAWWNLVSIFSCAIAKWYNVPVILSPRGMLTAYTSTNRNSLAKKIIHRFLGKNLLKYCHIHVTSEKEKRDVLTIITPKSITVIPNLVELGGKKSSGVHRPSFDETTNNEQRATNNDCRPSFDEATLKVQSSESKVLSPPSSQFTETNDNQSVQSTNRCNEPRSEHFKLIFLSRIEEKKGLEILFEALSSIQLEWNLTIAGSGEENYVKSLKTKAESLKISGRINWIGQVKNENKFDRLAEHDLMVLTSYNENFANVVIESLSVGTAVLLSKEVGLADYVTEKNFGWVTDLTTENIKHNIITAFESENLRAMIKSTSPLLITEDFNAKNLIQKYFNLYSHVS